MSLYRRLGGHTCPHIKDREGPDLQFGSGGGGGRVCQSIKLCSQHVTIKQTLLARLNLSRAKIYALVNVV